MTQKEFNSYIETNSMPYSWIGQGYGYKEEEKDWNDIQNDEIIYIPEYSYVTDGSNIISVEDSYTKGDLIELVKKYFDFDDMSDQEIDWLASVLYENLDWQYPESLIDEGFFDDEELVGECKAHFN